MNLPLRPDLELHRQEDRVRPVDLVVGDVRRDEVGGDREPVAGLLPRVLAHLRLGEVHDHVEVADAEAHRPADAVAEDAAAAQQRLPPLLERGEHLVRRQHRGAGCLFRARSRPAGCRAARRGSAHLSSKIALDLGIRVERLRDRQLAVVQLDHGARGGTRGPAAPGAAPSCARGTRRWSVKIESFSRPQPVVAEQLVAQEHRRAPPSGRRAGRPPSRCSTSPACSARRA